MPLNALIKHEFFDPMDDGVIIEEIIGKQADQTQYDLENFQEMDEVRDDETACEMDDKRHDELILANLNIVKNNPTLAEYKVKGAELV